MLHVAVACAVFVFWALFPSYAAAQTAPIQYGYDELGRLVVVVDPAGNTAIYHYDLVGNLLSIERVDPSQVSSAVAVTHFTPQAGKVGATISIFGKGFATTAGHNTVSFNGGLAAIKSASTNRLIVTVPAAALTGPISVTSPSGAATSAKPFRLLGPLGVSPATASVNAGGSLQLTATGVGGVTPAVDWSVVGAGAISPTGLYTAPAALPQAAVVTIRAVERDDPTNAASAAVTVVATGTVLFAAARDVSAAFPASIFIVGSVGTSVSGQVAPLRSSASSVDVSAYVGGSSAATALSRPITGSFEPFIHSVVPGTIGRGASNANVTLVGAGFDANAAAVALVGQVPDPNVSVGISSVSSDGTHAVLTVTTTANAAPGARVMRIGTSTDVNTGANVLTVTSQSTPVIAWTPPAAITYGTPLGSVELSATASIEGAFAYTPPLGTVLGAGNGQTLTALFTPADAAYTPAQKTVTIDVAKAIPAVTWPAPAPIVSGTPLDGTQLNATAPVPGAFVYAPPAGTVLNPGEAQTLSVTFTPADALNYAAVTASVTITVRASQTPAVITWPPPAAITYPTPLGAAQLNATANVPGTFVYTPPAGTVLNAGPAQVLSVTFTPDDGVDYASATASVTINVRKQRPVVTWSGPAAITYGTPLDTIQLDATANVPGTFVYVPAAGTVLTAGRHTLTATFTPDDLVDERVEIVRVRIVVRKATPTLVWDAPAAIDYGTPLGDTQLDATASMPGTFVYTPRAGAVLHGGAHTLSVRFTPADANYDVATASVPITVRPVAPALTWATPAPIVYGAPLRRAQLDARASVGGSYVYDPPAGTVLIAGRHTLSVTFTPSHANDYTTVTASVTLQVDRATPAVKWAKPAAITYPAPLTETQLDATAPVPGVFGYAPPVGTVLNRGAGQTLSVTFTPDDQSNYTTGTKTVTITVR